jgi:hypothetical protein
MDKTHLDTVVTISKVVHGLELLVNDSNASFMGAVGDLLDVGGRLAQLGQLLIDDLGRLDGRLGVEFGCRQRQSGASDQQAHATKNTDQDMTP